MSDTDKKTDENKFNETLKRMLDAPPKPHVKKPLTESEQEIKPGGTPGKKHRPEQEG